MTTDSCLQRPVPKTATATVYLMEELGDARLRCDQLVRYMDEAVKLVENSSHRDHFFEVAGHLIQAMPETLFKLQKALQAVALAATRIDYEEIKQELRPEKVDQLERVLQDVRIRHVQRRSEPWTPEQAAKALRAMVAKIQETGHLPRTELMSLILGLEFGLKTAEAGDTAKAIETIVASLEASESAPSQLHLAALLRRIYADDTLKVTREQETMDRTAEDWKASNGTTKVALAAGPGNDPRGLQAVLAMIEDIKTASIGALRNANAGRWKMALLSLGEAVETMGTILAQLGNSEGADKSTVFYREIRQTALKVPHGGPVVEVREADWKTNDAKTAEGELPTPLAPDAAPRDEAEVDEGLEHILLSVRKAQMARQAGNTKRMFFSLLGVINGVGLIGRSYDLPDVGYLMRVYKSFVKMSGARPTTNFSASEEEKESRFEEGKPADPTENMSPEDAKRWKEEHDKHKDKFKAGSDDEKESRFEEGKPADPTENMSPEDAKRWKEEHAKNKDNFKKD